MLVKFSLKFSRSVLKGHWEEIGFQKAAVTTGKCPFGGLGGDFEGWLIHLCIVPEGPDLGLIQ